MITKTRKVAQRLGENDFLLGQEAHDHQDAPRRGVLHHSASDIPTLAQLDDPNSHYHEVP